MQKIIERIKQIILKPKETWEIIKTEEATIQGLFKEYLIILAAVPAIANLLGRWIIGINIPFAGTYKFTLGGSLLNAILGYVLMVAGVWVAGKVISLLAPKFGSESDDLKGFKVALFSYTPLMAAGVLYIIPALSPIVFIAGLYGLYILYIGLPIVMGTPKEKALSYTVVVIVTLIVISIIIGAITTAFLGLFGPQLPSL